MRGTQLTRLISKLRAELSRSTLVSVGVDDVEILKNTLQRVQETLYYDYDWPHLRQMFPAVQLMAGQRYYELPDLLNYERIETVAVRRSGRPVPLERGITFEHYCTFDSDAGIRAPLAQRWDVRWVETKEQIEVWPIPADSSEQVQFEGIRALHPLIDGKDVCDLDDNLVVLFAAYELLQHAESADANVKLKAAQALYSRLKGRVTGGSSDVRMGMGRPNLRPFRATVAISGR